MSLMISSPNLNNSAVEVQFFHGGQRRMYTLEAPLLLNRQEELRGQLQMLDMMECARGEGQGIANSTFTPTN